MADKERVDVTKLDELTRRDLIKRAGAGVILVYGGLGSAGRAYGAPKFRHKELAGTLRILQCRGPNPDEAGSGNDVLERIVGTRDPPDAKDRDAHGPTDFPGRQDANRQ